MAFFILDAGTSTVSCLALPALRMRVSISAMGSVICIVFPPVFRVTALMRYPPARFRSNRRSRELSADWQRPFVSVPGIIYAGRVLPRRCIL